MIDDREKQIDEAIDAVLARLRVQEFALLELLYALPRHNAITLANGLRARVNEWALDAGPRFTPAADESASEQLATFLGALDDAPTMPAQLQVEIQHR
ncbi:MAG TPA: hypothetical protein VGP22_15120 [Albitalea sp.]|nr:hypothetical protein [Albitalea sp.]